MANKIHSIREKLFNISSKRAIDYNIILTWYALERLLYRLSKSKYADRYILKGAMLFSLWSGKTFRPTKDIDFLGYGESSSEYLKTVFTDIIQINHEQEDGLTFLSESINVQPIREEQEYGGQRITLIVMLGTARIRLQIDVGFGDAVTPSPQKVNYPTLLDMSAPEILSYTRETVVAEKFHAINVLGLTTSRMKDYYDLWILSKQYEFDGNLLADAIRTTFERRKTSIPSELPLGLTQEFYTDNVILTRWNSFVNKTELTVVEKSLEEVIKSLEIFFSEILQAISENRDFKYIWDKTQWNKSIK